MAHRLSQGGVRVCIVDQAEPTSGTTSASFAWLNANNKTPREYFELNRAGMEEHRRLDDELPGASWLRPVGNLIWSTDPEDLARRIKRLRGWGYAAERLTARRVNEDLEPGVVFPGPDTPVAFFPEESWVDAPGLTRALVEAARRNGAETRFGVAVESVALDDRRVSGVRLAGGERVAADAVVNAAGAGADRVAATVGRKLPLDSKRGLLARVAVNGEPLRRLLHTPRVNLRPDGPGRMVLHSGTVDEKLGTEPVGTLREDLLARAREVLPALQRAEALEDIVGIRPVPADGLSCVGAVPGLDGYYEAVTHSGVTLGPLVGRLLAREIREGEVDPLLAPFRPGRFGV